MSAGRAPRQARSRALDVLRAIAVLLVIGRHAHLPLDGAGSTTLGRALEVWQRGGWVGVDLFFVLSGFLVSGLLFEHWAKTGSLGVGRFLLRRGLKIYPAFYVFVLFSVLQTGLRRGWDQIPLGRLLPEVLFVQNYWRGIFQQTWSLAVEEHFYLLCALGFYGLSRRRSAGSPFRVVPAVSLLLGVACLVGRAVTLERAPFVALTHLFPTHLRIDALAFGVCLSYWFHFQREALVAWIAPRRALVLALGAALVAPVFVFHLDTTPLLYTAGLTAAYVGSGLIVIVAAERDLAPTRFVRLMAFFGASSYSIYLWHAFAYRVAEHLTAQFNFTPTSLLTFLTYVFGSLAGGVIMARLVEVPVLALRDRVLPATAPVGARDESALARSLR